ncbi:hypothetical protein D3C79_351590 [compost metagenome]
MGEIGGDAFAERLADAVQVFRFGRVFRADLIIQRITFYRLRAAGEYHAFAAGVFRRAENIVGAEDIVIFQRVTKIGIGGGIGGQVQHGIDIGAGRAAGIEIGNVEADHFIVGLQAGQQVDVSFRQPQLIAISHRLTECRGDPATRAGNQNSSKLSTQCHDHSRP